MTWRTRAMSGVAAAVLLGTCDLLTETDAERVAGEPLPSHTSQTKHIDSALLGQLYSGPPYEFDLDFCMYTDGNISSDQSISGGTYAAALGIATVTTGNTSLDLMLGHSWQDITGKIGRTAGLNPKKGAAFTVDATHMVITVAGAVDASSGGLSTIDADKSIALLKAIADRLG